MSISVVRRCHCTTACHNVVDCFRACTAHAASGTDISMQDVVLVVPSPKSLVLSSHHQSLSRTRKVRSLQPSKGLSYQQYYYLNGCGPKISLGATFWAPVSNSTCNPGCHRRMKQGNERMGEWYVGMIRDVIS